MFDTMLLDSSENSIKKAAELIRAGEVVGMPTETVYGLAANAFNENAVRKIFAAKGRPADNPLIVHVSSFEEISPLVTEIPVLARKCAELFWPGPLTMIMPKSDMIPANEIPMLGAFSFSSFVTPIPIGLLSVNE